MKDPFSTVLDQLAQERAVQKFKYSYTYTVNQAVPNGGTFPVTLNIQDDADFEVQKITLSAYGPTDVNGVRSIGAATDFPLAGTTVGFADRGLQVKITDDGSGRQLTNGFVGLELFGAPGYGVQMHMPFPYKTTFKARSQIIFEFNNRDTVADLYHFVSIALTGVKYALGSQVVGKSK
jgi:hypothetical protein